MEIIASHGRVSQLTSSLFVDNIIAQCPRAMRVPPIRDALFSDVIFHEIGHHVHTTRAREFREREEVADDWALRIGRSYFRTRAWYLIPLVKLFGLELFGKKINRYVSVTSGLEV